MSIITKKGKKVTQRLIQKFICDPSRTNRSYKSENQHFPHKENQFRGIFKSVIAPTVFLMMVTLKLMLGSGI